MRISKKAEYALRALLVFARSPRTYQVQELSAKENIPVKFLEQILVALKKAGLLNSKRGTGGGYVLRVDPEVVTVGAVVEIIDGPLAPVACAAQKPAELCSCPDPRACALRLLMIQVREEIAGVLGSKTLSDMASMPPGDSGLAFEI